MSTPVIEMDMTTFVDVDTEVPCAAYECEYGRPPARWSYITFCGCWRVVCDPCKEQIMGVLTGSLKDETIVGRCGRCSAPYEGLLRDWARVVPFG